MTALYRSGRQADALQRYQRTRAALVNELGLEPSAALRALHQQVLQHDEQLAGPPPDSPGGSLGSPHRQPGATTGATLQRSGSPVPAAVQAIIGRAEELDSVRELLGAARLVSLIGPGGAGKTTLAYAVARAVEADYPDGVWVAQLAAVQDPDEVVYHLAEAVGAPVDGAGSGADPRDRVVAYLRRREALLVLDNCEHVVDAAARLAGAVLARCPAVRILATTREALAVPGEVQFAVVPLSVPTPRTPRHQILDHPAAQLFAQRAAGVGVQLTEDGAQLEAVGQICRQLDGIPLAIELAAARLTTLSVVELAGRLADRFEVLTGGARTADARQRTLRAAVDWSYNLLSAAEQLLFGRLAIFQGGWTLAAAEAVVADEQLPRSSVLDLLGLLVARSLVTSEPDGQTRYHMLDTLRHYAIERLDQRGERNTVAERHAAYFGAMADQAELARSAGLRRSDLYALGADQPNLRAALSWLSDDPSRIDAALNLAGAMGWFWYLGRHMEGRQALSLLLKSGAGSPAARARALQAVSFVERPQGCLVHPNPRCAETAAESLRLFEEVGDPHRAAVSRILLAVEGVNGSDPVRFEELLQLAERVCTEQQDRWGHAVIAFVRMENHIKSGDQRRALQIGRAGIDAFRDVDDVWGVSAMLFHLGAGLRQFGEYAQAVPVLEEAIEQALSMGMHNTAQWAHADKGLALLFLGEMDAAAASFDRARAASEDVGDAAGDLLAYYGTGLSARITGDWPRAREQFAVAAAGFEDTATPIMSGLVAAGLAACDEHDGTFDTARGRYESALTIGETVRDPALTATALEGLARVAAATGHDDELPAFLERAHTIRERHNRPAPPHERAGVATMTAAMAR
jgi:predicted ATPase